MRKRLWRGGIAALMILLLTLGAGAALTPDDVAMVDRGGVRQCIKTFTVAPDYDLQKLEEAPFTQGGFTYTLLTMTKEERYFEDERPHTETATVKTATDETSAVLAALPATKEYNDGRYRGTLSLNTATIRTKAAGYENRSDTVTETREFADLDGNDMSYIPSTVVKDGVTLNLQSVDWEVQSSELVEDMLLPATYKAAAHYVGTVQRKVATGYVTTASYTGNIACRELRAITCTLTYAGEPTPEADSSPSNGAADRGTGTADAITGTGDAESTDPVDTDPADGSGTADMAGSPVAGNPEDGTAETDTPEEPAGLDAETGNGANHRDALETADGEKAASIRFKVLYAAGTGGILTVLIIALAAWRKRKKRDDWSDWEGPYSDGDNTQGWADNGDTFSRDWRDGEMSPDNLQDGMPPGSDWPEDEDPYGSWNGEAAADSQNGQYTAAPVSGGIFDSRPET